MDWNEKDFTIYSDSKLACYKVDINGNVDINIGDGSGKKVSVLPGGMFKLVKSWLKSKHDLTDEQKSELITILIKE